ncbi:MAG: hypothetical protein AAB799_01495, partial [Patescibacteria group bacterium]
AVMVRYKESLAFDEEAIKNPLFTYVSGFVFLILGVLLVVSHSVWTPDWRLVITILGWLVLLKGVGRIFFSNAVRRLIERKRNNRRFLLGEIVVFMVGPYLLYYGFFVY